MEQRMDQGMDNQPNQVQINVSLSVYFKLISEIEMTIAELSNRAAEAQNTGYLDERLNTTRTLLSILYNNTWSSKNEPSVKSPPMPTPTAPRNPEAGAAGTERAKTPHEARAEAIRGHK